MAYVQGVGTVSYGESVGSGVVRFGSAVGVGTSAIGAVVWRSVVAAAVGVAVDGA